MVGKAQQKSSERCTSGSTLCRGRHGIRVNDQYRITFRFANGHAYEVRCEDYH